MTTQVAPKTNDIQDWSNDELFQLVDADWAHVEVSDAAGKAAEMLGYSLTAVQVRPRDLSECLEYYGTLIHRILGYDAVNLAPDQLVLDPLLSIAMLSLDDIAAGRVTYHDSPDEFDEHLRSISGDDE